MKRHSDARVSFQVSRLCMGLQHVLQYRKTFSALCVLRCFPLIYVAKRFCLYTSKLVLEFFSLDLFSCTPEDKRSRPLGPIVWSKLNKHI